MSTPEEKTFTEKLRLFENLSTNSAQPKTRSFKAKSNKPTIPKKPYLNELKIMIAPLNDVNNLEEERPPNTDLHDLKPILNAGVERLSYESSTLPRNYKTSTSGVQSMNSSMQSLSLPSPRNGILKNKNTQSTEQITDGESNFNSIDSRLEEGSCSSLQSLQNKPSLQRIIDIYEKVCENYRYLELTDARLKSLVEVADDYILEAYDLIEKSFTDPQERSMIGEEFKADIETIFYKATSLKLQEAYEKIAIAEENATGSVKRTFSIFRSKKKVEGRMDEPKDHLIQRQEVDSEKLEKYLESYVNLQLDAFRIDLLNFDNETRNHYELLEITEKYRTDMVMKLEDLAPNLDVQSKIHTDFVSKAKEIMEKIKSVRINDLYEIELNQLNREHIDLDKNLFNRSVINFFRRKVNSPEQIGKHFEADLKLIFHNFWIKTSPRYFLAVRQSTKHVLESYKKELSSVNSRYDATNLLEKTFLQCWSKFLLSKVETAQIDKLTADSEFLHSSQNMAIRLTARPKIEFRRDLDRIVPREQDK